jgi:hypothetical protein
MDLVSYKKWVLQVDREATREAYAATPSGGSDECGCLYCQNFAAAREHLYPEEFLALLEQLGIDYRKEVEVWEASAPNARIRFCSGWFHFVGKILSTDNRETPRRVTLAQTHTKLLEGQEPIGGNFALGFSNRRDVISDAFEKHSVVQLDFSAEVPWVLEEEHEA